MKRFFPTLILIVFVLLASISLASAEIGIPAAGPNGLSLEFQGDKVGLHINAGDMESNLNLKSDQVFLKVAYGLGRLELFGKVGAANLLVKDIYQFGSATVNIGTGVITNTSISTSDAKDGMSFALGAGAKATVFDKGNFRLGAIGHVTRYSTYGDQKSGLLTLTTVNPSLGTFNVNATEKVEAKHPLEYGLAVGPSYRLTAGKVRLTPYSAVLLNWYRVKVMETISGTLLGAPFSESDSATAKQEKILGGVVGVQVDVSARFKATAEAGFGGRKSLGGGMTLLF